MTSSSTAPSTAATRLSCRLRWPGRGWAWARPSAARTFARTDVAWRTSSGGATMTGLVCRITLLGVGGLLGAGTALAAIPDPAHSILPKVIYVVGRNASGVDPYGTFSVTIRDIGGHPVAGAFVAFDFT